jgi:hypothetical protein
MSRIGWMALASSLVISSAYAQVHKSLPKGVRMMAYRNVNTSKIDATYNQSQAVSPLSFDVNADARTLESVGEAVRLYFEELRAISPAAYEQMTFGQFKLSAEAQVQVHGFAAGYGINDRLTVYGILPYYTGRVDMKYRQVRSSNVNDVADEVEQSGGGDVDSTIANITNALPGATGNLLQSVVVNTFKYEELGNWQGSGYGDLELGAMYRLADHGTWGFSITAGLFAPTGVEDDPDLLQDIAFGDGQWDVFVEGAYGHIINDNFMLGNVLRYTYQAPAEKSLRIPMDRDFALSDKKGSFVVKYGDKIDYIFSMTYTMNDWFSMTPAYEVNYQMSSEYDSVYDDANEYLAYNSDRVGHVARLTTTISSIQPYLKKKFVLPATINLNLQQTVAGQNVPRMGRVELEFRMLF